MSESPAPPLPARGQVFVICIVIAAMTILDISKVNVALPYLQRVLDAGPTALQLIVAGYTLAFGLALVPAGRYGDLQSRRRMFLIGIVLFAVASLACTLAPEQYSLVAGRLVQGLAAGLIMPQVFGTLQQLYTGPERGRAFGTFGAVLGLSVAFGPVLGGALIALGGDELGWRLLFAMNIPIAVVVLPLAMRAFPRNPPLSDGRVDIDPVGILLLGAAVVALMLPFVFTTGSPDDDPRRWLTLVAFAVLIVLFVLWERRYSARGGTPLIELSLFRIAGFRHGISIGAFYIGGFPALILTTTLFVQLGLGLSPLISGLISAVIAVLSALGSWWSGRLVHRIGQQLLVGGVAIVIAGILVCMITALLLPRELAPWGIVAGFVVGGMGAGLVTTTNQTLTIEDVPVSQGGLAGSIGQVGQRIGTAIGVAMASSAFYGTVSVELAGEGAEVAYHDAYRNGMLVVLALMAGALAVGLVDLRRRRSVHR